MDFSNLQADITSAVSAATPDVSAPDPTPAPAEPTSTAADGAAPPEPVAPATDDEFEFPEDAPPATVAAVPDPAAEEDPDELGDLNGLMPKEVQSAFLKTPRGKKLYNGFRLSVQLEKPVEQGGLGMIPSVDQVREMHQDSQDLRLMAHEFHHGDPTYAQNFVKQWFAPGPNGHTPGAQLAAKSFLTTLQGMAQDAQQPEAYRQHASRMYVQAALPAVEAHIEDFYRRGLAEQDTERRITLLNVARVMEEDLTGKYRDLPAGVDTADFVKAQPQVDPRASQLDAQVRYINDFQNRQTQQAEQQFAQGFNAQIGDGLNADVTAALKPLSEALPPKVFAASQASFIKDVHERMKANPAQLRNFTIARDQARRSRSPQDVKAAADAWRSVARPIIKQLRADYLKDAQPQIEAASAKRHATLGEAALKTGTSSVAQPVARNLAGGPGTRLPGESHDEYINRVTRIAVSAAS